MPFQYRAIRSLRSFRLSMSTYGEFHPSTGSKFGDYSAFALPMVDSEGTVFIDADMARRNIDVLIDTTLEIQRQFKPD